MIPSSNHLPQISPNTKVGLSIYAGDQHFDQDLEKAITESGLVFQSTAMKQLLREAYQFARNSASILITGESGTGKELLCQFVHSCSKRRENNFVAVNCAAIPELLVESEFFGHSRGAFTGAFQQRIGHFERAHGGTILLDEISEIPLSTQSKLLRVLEEKEVQRVGSNESRKIDVRVIATSNRDLRQEVANGNFRLDLYHRLNVLNLNIKPLRERKADIPCLANHFIQLYKSESENAIYGMTAKAKDELLDYKWPGNVRELRNIIQRATILCRQHLISTDCLPTFELLANKTEGTELRGKSLKEVERILIIDSMVAHKGDKNSVANELGITTRTLNSKLKAYREDGHTLDVATPLF